jgi:hypothetical protein
MHMLTAAYHFDIRIVSIAMGGMVVGLSLFVLRLYMAANRIANTSHQRVPGALPYHVWAMALSHLLLTQAAISLITYRMLTGRHIYWWFIVPATVGWALSLFALATLLKWEQTRVHLILKATREEKHQ